MTEKTKRRSLLFGMIILHLIILAVLIYHTPNAYAEQTVQLTMPDGSVVNAVIQDPEPSPNQSTYDLMNALTAGEGNYVPTTNGDTIWIPRTPYGPGIRNRP